MSLEQILAYLAPFAPLLKPEVLKLEQAGADELKMLIQSHVSSPDLQALLVILSGALDEFAKLEIGKI